MRACTLLLLRRGDAILLAMKKRGFGAGRWNGVGGKVNNNENVEQALVRECYEEIGVMPLVYKKVAVHDFHFPDSTFDQRVHTFTCTKWDGQPSETEEMAPRWFKLSEIPYDNMWPDDVMWLPLVLRNKKLHCNFNFDENGDIAAANLKIVDSLSKQ